MIELRTSRSSAMGSQRIRILINKGYRPRTMLETSNVLQGEPQQADLNMRRNLISHLPHPVSFRLPCGRVRFISRQSGLIGRHNAVKGQPDTSKQLIVLAPLHDLLLAR